MLQAEPFEKIILTFYDITYVTELRVPPIKSKYWPLSFIFIDETGQALTILYLYY